MDDGGRWQLIFDFDSTLVGLEGLDELMGESAKTTSDTLEPTSLADLRTLTSQAMSGNLDFETALKRRVLALRVTQREVEVVAKRIASAVSPSVLRHAAFFKKHAPRIYIISGGFREFIAPVAQRLGLHDRHVFCNSFVYDAYGRVIGYDRSHLTAKNQGKVKQARRLKHKGTTIAIGDGMTDYELRSHGIAQTFIAYVEFCKRDAVVARADFVAQSMDDVVRHVSHIVHMRM
jgi:D-3-phosphoglycerate dehydrogenase